MTGEPLPWIPAPVRTALARFAERWPGRIVDRGVRAVLTVAGRIYPVR